MSYTQINANYARREIIELILTDSVEEGVFRSQAIDTAGYRSAKTLRYDTDLLDTSEEPAYVEIELSAGVFFPVTNERHTLSVDYPLTIEESPPLSRAIGFKLRFKFVETPIESARYFLILES